MPTSSSNFQPEQLVEATIEQLQDALSNGSLTSQQLVLFYMERIAAYDKCQSGLNSVLELNPDALHIAEALDLERQSHGIRGPLHGIPVLIKDNIDTGDHMHTSAGSLALADSYASKDSFVAAQLRKAGAILLGKTNMTEWANFMTVNMPNGFSSRGGQVLNPYGPGRFDTGGSSSGSGVSIAANLAAAAVGTETSGSILSPASSNSIVGIKPTVGLISRSGIIPIAHSQDTAGPMARTVRDAALLLGVLTGIDPEDAATWSSADRFHTDYTRFLETDGLKGARIGIARDYYKDLDEQQLAILNAAIEDIKAAGAIVIDPVEIASAKEKWGSTVLIYEFKSDLNAYLKGVSGPVHSLKDVIAFNNTNAEATLKHGQTQLLDSEKTSGTLTEPEYIRARIRDLRLSQEEGIDDVMNRNQLDALLFPANYGAGIAAKAGYPSITVPGGYTTEGKPFGVTFSAKAFSEPTLLRLAYAYEQATKHRVPPQLTQAD